MGAGTKPSKPRGCGSRPMSQENIEIVRLAYTALSEADGKE